MVSISRKSETEDLSPISGQDLSANTSIPGVGTHSTISSHMVKRNGGSPYADDVHENSSPSAKPEDEKKQRIEKIADWEGVVDRWQKMKRETEMDLHVMDKSSSSPPKNQRSRAKHQAISVSPPASPQRLDSSGYLWASSSPQKSQKGNTVELSSSPIVSQLSEQISIREAKSTVVTGLVAQIASGQKLHGKSLPEVVAARMIELKSARRKKKTVDDSGIEFGQDKKYPNNNSTIITNGMFDNTTDIDLSSSSILESNLESGSFEAMPHHRDDHGDSEYADSDSTPESSFRRRDYALSQPRPQPRLGFRSNSTSVSSTPHVSMSQSRSKLSARGVSSSHAQAESPESSKQAFVRAHDARAKIPQAGVSPSDSIFSPLVSTCRYCAFQVRCLV